MGKSKVKKDKWNGQIRISKKGLINLDNIQTVLQARDNVSYSRAETIDIIILGYLKTHPIISEKVNILKNTLKFKDD